MKRRSFIKRSSAVTLPLVLGGVKVEALNNPFFNAFNVEDDRVLVLIQLNGGNDGLNMVIPKDQYSNLAQVRSNIIIPENQILNLTDTVGLHPVMGELKNVFDNGKLNIVQSAGYPNQNRSHFRSTDIWSTGSSAEEIWTKGWLGRYFDLLAPNFPAGYPNAGFPDPLAITIGSSVSETCEGEGGNFSLALSDPDNLTALTTPINNDSPDSCFGDKMDFLVTSIVQTNAYNGVVETANQNGSNLSTKYVADNNLSESLKVVARLISGGLQTKVYVVNLGGFDTHGDQVVASDTTTGEHAVLLKELSDAIAAFQDDLELLGIDERVIGMTYSEFGRRIRSNGSLGTDHGTAAPMILFGSCVNPGIMGTNPEISVDVDTQEGVPMQFDFRSVYGSILMDWFGLELSVVQGLLHQGFEYVPILLDCSDDSGPHVHLEDTTIDILPHPTGNIFTITGVIGSYQVRILDENGATHQTLTGSNVVNIDMNNLPAGLYFLHIERNGNPISAIQTILKTE